MIIPCAWSYRALAVLSVLFISLTVGVSPLPQEKGKEKPVQASEGERKAAQKINDAKDPAAKLQAANEFVQKFPKSALRPKIVEVLIREISDLKTPAQKIPLAETFMGTFSEASEANRMYPVLIEAYVGTQRLDDAFNAAKPWLELNPNEVDVLYMLARVGTDEARRQNNKFAASSQQYGLKAIELIEADKRPEGITADAWVKAKATWLPPLYQSMGLLALLQGNNAEAITKIQKSSSLDPNDPFNYVLLGNLKNEDYTRQAKAFQAMPVGQARTDTEKKLFAQLDEIIELYAHALGLMEGKQQYQQLSERMLPDLTSYYKFRHKSTDGMQDLIRKYKPSTP